MKPEKTPWRKGWSRALSNESDRPVTLPKAPWETETKEDSK